MTRDTAAATPAARARSAAKSVTASRSTIAGRWASLSARSHRIRAQFASMPSGVSILGARGRVRRLRAPPGPLVAAARQLLARPLRISEGSVIVGVGLDVVETARVAKALARYGERFTQRVYTTAEMTACAGRADRIEALAARFAA